MNRRISKLKACKLKHVLVFFILNLSSFVASAQSSINLADELYLDSLSSSKVILHSGYFFSSDAITNQLALAYTEKQFISDKVKDGVSKNLSSMNHLGGGLDEDVFFIFHPDSGNKSFGAYAGLRNHYHLDSRFSQDLFEVYFRGNKNYAGKTADFSDFELKSYNYQQFTGGISNDYYFHDGGRLHIGVGVSIIQGTNTLQINSNKATLYTQEDGEYLKGNFDITLQKEDSTSKKFYEGKGSGVSGDFFAEYETQLGDKFSVTVENFGKIFWNRYSSIVRIDSSFKFEGVDVSDLFNFNDSVKTKFSIDSTFNKDSYITSRKKDHITTTLPLNIKGAYTHPYYDGRLNITLGAEYMFDSNTKLKEFIVGDIKINSLNELSIILSYGGYSFFNAGLMYEHHFAHGFSITAGSDYLSSMIVYNKGLSQGAFVSLSKNFR